MRCSSPTLADLMVMLPQLHPRQLAHTNTATLKQLRLVSSEIGSIALTAVTSCEVHLGEGRPSPSPEDLVKLISGANLRQLKVVVIVKAGGCGVESVKEPKTAMIFTLH